MLGLALEGAALVACAEVDAGMQRLDEATATALEGNAAIPISGAWACCFLVSACTAVRDHERAYGWCDRIADFAERFGSRYMLAFCRSEYGIVHLWRGDWAAADSMLAASVEDFAASRPAWVAAPLVTLAELRRRQGRVDEAATLLDDVGAGASAHTSRAWLALDAGDTARAVELAQRALRRVPASRRLDTASRARGPRPGANRPWRAVGGGRGGRRARPPRPARWERPRYGLRRLLPPACSPPLAASTSAR